MTSLVSTGTHEAGQSDAHTCQSIRWRPCASLAASPRSQSNPSANNCSLIIVVNQVIDIYEFTLLSKVCRLQTTFPLSQTQHLFLVACELTSNSDCNDRDGDKEERIIGFCKVDGREDTDMHRTLIESFPEYESAIPSSPYCTDLAVHPNNRRRGVAKEIMLEVERRIKSWDNVDALYLGVETDNQYALNMYRELGYEIFVEDMMEKNRSVHLLRRYLG